MHNEGVRDIASHIPGKMLTLDRKSIDVVKIEPIHVGFNRLQRFVFRFRRFDGMWSNPIEREVLERADACVVLPYDPKRDRVVFIEQFRIVASLMNFPPHQLEPIGGLLEAGSSPEATVRREAVEEAGLVIDQLIPLGRFLLSPGCLTEIVNVYCCLVDTEGVGGFHGCVAEEEDIRVHVLEFTEVERRLAAGEFGYMVTALSVYWLAANRERLRRKWLAGPDGADADGRPAAAASR